jgi:hypothetical protein
LGLLYLLHISVCSRYLILAIAEGAKTFMGCCHIIK